VRAVLPVVDNKIAISENISIRIRSVPPFEKLFFLFPTKQSQTKMLPVL
jgi:hypothetical protein